MRTLKQQLLERLADLDGLAVVASPVAGGTALTFRGREFAHFHHDHELDLRLTRPVIASVGLVHPPGSTHHPTRSTSSAWIEIRFTSEAEVARAAELVRLAAAQLGGGA